MENYRQAYEEWLSNPYFDEATKAELRAIADDENEVKERFYTELEFGTAGTSRSYWSRYEPHEPVRSPESNAGTCKLYCQGRQGIEGSRYRLRFQKDVS